MLLPRTISLALTYVLFFLALSSPAQGAADPYQEELMQQLILAQPGDVIEIAPGHYRFDSELSLTVDNVTIKGQSPETTVLDFSEQQSGAEGLLVTGNGVLLEGFAITNTKGDGIKAISVQGLTVRNVHIAWTGEQVSSNGGYGLYPVKSANILIEDCDISGASDAGIYVGQSRQVVVRRNIVHANVGGIEIENTNGADVYDNYAYNNTAGMLVFNLPDLSQLGRGTRVFRNVLVSNNHINFAAPINTVADVPQGTGLMLLAAKDIEVFENFITDNDTANILLVHYGITGRPVQDASFDPFIEGISLHNNTLLRAGRKPIGGSSPTSRETIAALNKVLPTPFPDIIYDGSYNPAAGEPPNIPAERRICINEAASTRFINLDLPHDSSGLSSDISKFGCQLPSLPPVQLNEATQL